MTPILYNPDDEDDEQQEQSAKQSPAPAPGNSFIVLWLFAAVTAQVTIPALTLMLIGLKIGERSGHKQLYATIGTIVGLGVATLLVTRYFKQINKTYK